MLFTLRGQGVKKNVGRFQKLCKFTSKKFNVDLNPQ